MDYVKFTYEVDENDNITVSEPEYVSLTVSPKEVNSTIAELNKELETIKAELDIKNDAIIKASENIQSLKVTISELEPYKEKVETAEREKVEAQIAEEKEKLKAKMLKGNLFTEEEIAEKNIADLIEARDESAINSLIADRFVASFDDVVGTDVSETDVEVATVSTSLEVDDVALSPRELMRNYLFN